MKYIPGLITKKLPVWKGKQFYHQRFDGSPYLIHYIAEAEIIRDTDKKLGGDFSVHYCFFKDDKGDWYISMDDIKKVYTAILEAGKTNPHLSSDLIKQWQPAQDKFYDTCVGIGTTDLTTLNDKELMQLHDEFLDIALNKNSSSSIIDGFALGTDQLVADKIKEVYDNHPIKDKMRFTEVFSALTAPVHLSFINEAEIELLKMALEVKKDPALKQKLLEDHQKRFFWTRNNYIDAIVLDVEYFEKELNSILSMNSDIKSLLDNIENTPKRNKQEKQRLMSELNLNEELKFMLKVSEDFTYWQDERKKGTLWTAHYASLILDEICSRLNIPIELIKYMSPREVSTVFEQKIDLNLLQERRDNSVIYWDKEGHEIVCGKECDDVKEAVLGGKSLDEVDDFRGLTASTGKAKGKVKILKSSKEIGKVEQGDILVAVMTRPDYVPAMKKAAAIVTDEGGITCHAAIVARELGIPCIIGTKIATMILKDNMVVEVNANHAWVRIVEK